MAWNVIRCEIWLAAEGKKWGKIYRKKLNEENWKFIIIMNRKMKMYSIGLNSWRISMQSIYLLLAQWWWWCRWGDGSWTSWVSADCCLSIIYITFSYFHCGIYLKSPHVRYLQFGIRITALLTSRQHHAKMCPLLALAFLRNNCISHTIDFPTWYPTTFLNFFPICAVFLPNSHEAIRVKGFLIFP